MGDGEVSVIVIEEDFQHYWWRMKERTALSCSGRHFGLYKTAEVHAMTVELATKTRAIPKRWSKRLSVILEKIAGVALLTKLRAILTNFWGPHDEVGKGQRPNAGGNLQ